MRARQTLDKHDFSSKNERKERKKIKKKKRKSFHAGPGTGLISSSIVSDDGDGVVCGVCRKWPNLQRIPNYLSSHLSALCDGAIDLIRFPYGVGSPKHIVFVSAHLYIHFRLLLIGPITEKKKFLLPFLVSRWCVASMASSAWCWYAPCSCADDVRAHKRTR